MFARAAAVAAPNNNVNVVVDSKQGAGILIRTLPSRPPRPAEASSPTCSTSPLPSSPQQVEQQRPQKGDTVLVTYQGFLETNREQPFCDSRQQPLSIVVDDGSNSNFVMEGWQLALPQLSLHQPVEVTIPHLYAYGQEGYPPKIPPKATLVFIMEIVKIIPGPTKRRWWYLW
jgi:FK506-binding protein 1